MKRIMGIVLRALWVIFWEVIQLPLIALLPLVFLGSTVYALIKGWDLGDFWCEVGEFVEEVYEYKLNWIIGN